MKRLRRTLIASVDHARMRSVAFQGQLPTSYLAHLVMSLPCTRFFFGNSAEDERQLPCCAEAEGSEDEEATDTEETEEAKDCRQCSEEEAGAGR